jgi:hypothetical protein
MAKSGIKTEGFKEAYAALDGLPLKLKANVLRSVHRKAANAVLKPGMPDHHGVNEFIKVAAARDEPTGIDFGVESRAFWFRFLEYGTSTRNTKKGYDRGQMPVDPFFAKYIDRKANAVIKYVNANYGDIIEKYFKRKFKRAMKK